MTDSFFGIDKSWIDAGLDIDIIRNVMMQILEKRKSVEILPKQEDVLNAIKLCPLDIVKVLIIGQDPYPSSEHAHGLAFSSLSDKTPASLKNIFKKLEQDFHCEHKTNTLINWEKQGVLLLNTALTFEGKETKLLREHTKLWSPIIENIFSILKKRGNLIVMRWGSHAQKAGEIFDESNGINGITILDTTHPSPLSAHRGFMSSEHFKKCNEILGKNAIDWST
ncbi:MAG: uracil-DNA glycosylase [bacterium]|nr:uracil-DNA glycosylase [bacterium]